jgi:hypothetical protein
LAKGFTKWPSRAQHVIFSVETNDSSAAVMTCWETSPQALYENLTWLVVLMVNSG